VAGQKYRKSFSKILIGTFICSVIPGLTRDLDFAACGRIFLKSIYSYFSLDRKVSKRSRLTPILEKSTVLDFTPRGNRFEKGHFLS
jgi:hypothetical protein